MPGSSAKMTILAQIPRELASVLATAAILAAVLALGALISAALPDGASLWLTASSYLAPAGLAFAARWWMDQSE